VHSAIPRLIHVIWIGKAQFPYRRYLDSWSEHNPGWRVRLWTDADRPELANEGVYRRLHVSALRADVLRLELLARLGGLYSDADSECLGPVGALVDAAAVGMTGRGGRVCVATLGCVPEYPPVQALVEGVAPRYDALREHRRNGRRGWSVHAIFGTRYVSPPLLSDPGFRLLPEELVTERRHAGARAVIVHDHAESWRSGTVRGGRRVRLR
jgi:hypothetical protein